MRNLKILLTASAILLTVYTYCLGANATLKWVANPESVDGYYIQYRPGSSDSYDNEKRVPLDELDNPPDSEYPEKTITGLLPNTAYYFVVQAYQQALDPDTGNLIDVRGGSSNEARIKAPQITSPLIDTYVSNNAVTVEWTTNEPGDTEARYGFNAADWDGYTESDVADGNVTAHTITLTGLLPDTTYYYRGGSTSALGLGPDFEDSDDNPSDYFIFKTTPEIEPDTDSPQFLIQPYATNITDTAAVIEWETDETATSIVNYGKTSTYGQTASDINTYVSLHRITLTGLESDTLYHFQAQSQDVAENPPLSSTDITFTTSITIDTGKPVFTSPTTVIDKTDTSVTIEWTTNESANTKLRYDTTSATWRTYSFRVEDFDTYVLNHRAVVTGLTPNTMYYFRAASSDPAPNQAISSEYSFTTEAAPDTLAPIITTTPTVVTKTDTTATILWDTNEPANSIIRFWEESWPETRTWENYQFTKNVSNLVNQHTVTLTNLTEQTRYYFMVGSSDALGNGPTTSFESTFVTDETPDIDPPQIISPPTVTAKTNQTVTIEWETDEPSNSIVQYGEDSSLWDMYPLHYFDPEGVTHHRVVIAGLDGDSIYFFRVGGTDAFNNGPNTNTEDNNPSAENSVLTETDPDFSAPQIISPPTVTAKTDSVAIIEWSTDEPATGIVNFGTAPGEWESYPLNEIDPSMGVTHSVTLADLDIGRKYYFRAGSVDKHGNGPLASPEFFFITDEVADTASPRISIPPTVTGITDSTVTIEWETDEPSNSEVKYVVTPESGGEPNFSWGDNDLAVVTTSSMVTQHSVTLTNLLGGMRYFFMVGSTDAAGNGPDPDDMESNNPFTRDFFYTEIARDERAPRIISGPTVAAKDNDSAIIEWETDEPSNSIVRFDITARAWFELTYGTPDTGLEECTTDDDGFEECHPVDEEGNRLDEITYRSESDSELVTLHSVTISGLQPSTTYFYRVGSNDALGNGPELNQDATNPSALDEFATEEGPDILAPFITVLRVFFVTNTTALITWETDEPSNSLIQYGTMGSDWDSYLFEEGDSGMLRNHSITITGLQPDTQYYFRAGSTDATGNGPWLNARESNPSDETTFSSATGPDVTAPQISNMRVVSVNDQTAVVEWITDEPGNSQVRYDTSSKQWLGYEYSENDAEMVTEHSVTITGLSPSTLYFLRVSSTDASGNNYNTSSSDTNPSNERNTSTSAADPPSIIVYPEADYPKADPTNNTIEITYDEPNMQNAMVEANYIISPDLTFAAPGNSIRQIGNFGDKSTYRLSYASVPEYTIFLLTVWDEITDADGYRVEPSTVLINDNDADDLPDDWEVAFGLDPTSADAEEGQGSNGDLDGDGYSNYDEFINQTDPTDSQNFPSPATILQVLPHDNAGIEDDFRVANNSAFAVLIEDSSGIDTTSGTSIVFTVDDGANDSYSIDLEDTDVLRVVQMNSDEVDTAVTLLWAVYDRSRDDQYGLFPYEATVNVSVRVTNNLGNFEDGFFSFKIESEEAHNQATDTNRIPEYSDLEVGDLDLNDDVSTYDRGFQLTQDELPGAKLIYHSSDTTPEIAPPEDLPLFDVTDANAIGIPLNLQPPTIFSVPVKLILPIPDDTNVSEMNIYLYDGENWVLGCDSSGNSDIPGWMVPGSRVNGNGRIELKVYHFSGLQAALLGEGTGGGSGGGSGGNGIAPPEDEVGSCFITDLLGLKTGL